MPACIIRNSNVEPVTLPAPLNLYLASGQAVVLDVSKSAAEALIAGANSDGYAGGLSLTDLPTYAGTALAVADLATLNTNTVQDLNNNNFLTCTGTANAVNGLVVTNSATGVYCQLAPGGSGSDTNCTLRIQGKGTGSVCLVNGANTAIRVEANNTGLGFFEAAPVAQQAAQTALTPSVAGDMPTPSGAEIAARLNLIENRLNDVSAALRNLGLIAT